MHYPKSRVKGRITNGSQCHIITVSPEELRRVKLALRHNQQDTIREKQEREKTMRVKSTLLIFRCLLLLSVWLINYIANEWLLWEQLWQQIQKSFVMHSGLALAATNKSLGNLELPNCQSAWLDVTLCFPSRVFVVVIYFISYFSNSLSQCLSEDMLSVCSHFSSVHL